MAAVVTCLLVMVNLAFGLLGFLLLGFGLFARFGSSLLKPHMASVLGSISHLPKLVNMIGAAKSEQQELAPDLGEILENAAIALIVLGAALFIISILGCVGACCQNKCFLIVYVIIVFILVIIQTVFVGLLFGHVLDTPIRNLLNVTIVEDFEAIDAFNPASVSWNYMQLKFSCCGVDGYEDYLYAENWKSDRVFYRRAEEVPATLITPVSCCKASGVFPNITIADEDCALKPTDMNNNMDTGCWYELLGFLSKYYYMAIGCSVAVIVLQIILAILAITVYRKMGKDY